MGLNGAVFWNFLWLCAQEPRRAYIGVAKIQVKTLPILLPLQPPQGGNVKEMATPQVVQPFPHLFSKWPVYGLGEEGKVGLLGISSQSCIQAKTQTQISISSLNIKYWESRLIFPREHQGGQRICFFLPLSSFPFTSTSPASLDS